MLGGLLNRNDLLRYHRQNLHIDSVELIKTGPCTRGGKPLEEFSHCQIVEAVGTIENDALLGKCFRQVFGGFSLACCSEVCRVRE